MPFEVVETESKHNRPPTAVVSHMRPKPRKGGKDYDRDKARPEFVVTLPTTIFIAKSDWFVLLVGTGEHRGKIRIRGVKAGENKSACKASNRKHCSMIKFGCVPSFGDEIFDSTRCALHRVAHEEYEIDVAFNIMASPVPTKKKVAA